MTSTLSHWVRTSLITCDVLLVAQGATGDHPRQRWMQPLHFHANTHWCDLLLRGNNWPWTIITMSTLIFLLLSFKSAASGRDTPLVSWTQQKPLPKTPRKWSSPLHLRRLCRHLFSLFWQAFLRSSPLQASVRHSLSPMLLQALPNPPHPPAYPHLFGAHPEWGAAMCFSHSSLPQKTSGGVGGVDGRHFLT